jgi:hypothetical protein
MEEEQEIINEEELVQEIISEKEVLLTQYENILNDENKYSQNFFENENENDLIIEPENENLIIENFENLIKNDENLINKIKLNNENSQKREKESQEIVKKDSQIEIYDEKDERRIKKVNAIWNDEKEIMKLVKNGLKDISTTIKKIDKKTQEEKNEIKKNLLKIISEGKKFNLLVFDPPWSFGVQSGIANNASNHYDTMTDSNLFGLGKKKLN